MFLDSSVIVFVQTDGAVCRPCVFPVLSVWNRVGGVRGWVAGEGETWPVAGGEGLRGPAGWGGKQTGGWRCRPWLHIPGGAEEGGREGAALVGWRRWGSPTGRGHMTENMGTGRVSCHGNTRLYVHTNIVPGGIPENNRSCASCMFVT